MNIVVSLFVQKPWLVIPLLPFSLIFYSCSASTDTRYSKSEGMEKGKIEEKTIVVEDDFDLTPYKTEFEILMDSSKAIENNLDLWYGYPEETEVGDIQKEVPKTVIDSIPGYRVQVISTDDLEEANGVRTEVYFKTNEKAIYVIFEPPFYLVRVGDYRNINDAKATSFKLNQLGFTGTKVINDLINLYK